MNVASVDYPTPTERAAITEYVAQIRSRFRNRVLAAMLFGSKARGDAGPESDIDLLVLVDVESREFRSQLWRIACDASLEYDVMLSPRVFGQERRDEARRIRLPLYAVIVADGLPLTLERVPA